MRVLQAGHDPSTGVTIGVLAALAGGIIVLAAGFLALRATTEVESARRTSARQSSGSRARRGNDRRDRRPVQRRWIEQGDEQAVTRSFAEAFDPIVVSLAIAVIAALLLGRRRHAELSAALLTLGVLDALLWIRYFGVPLVQDPSFGSSRREGSSASPVRRSSSSAATSASRGRAHATAAAAAG